MKYGIIIIALVVSAQVYGQQARMSAQTFAAFTQTLVTEQNTSTSGSFITTTLPATGSTVGSTTDGYTGTPATTGVVESTSNVVVQEELVAGRIASGEGLLDDKFDTSFNKIKEWISHFFDKK
ncbi:MAG: hypothetical protein WAT43_05275 [Chitinophagales bacterium]